MAAAASATRRVTIPYAPRRVFLPFHARLQRWAVIVAHRRCGKTVATLNDALARALTCRYPHGRYAYVAPFLAQAKEVAWEYLKRFAAPVMATKNEAELWIELVTGARLRVHGADNPDRLRGQYLDGVVLDEYADMRPSVWGEVIRPMLADRQGWAVFIGTPRGRNEFFRVWDDARQSPDWYAIVLRASETGVLPADELAAARREMTAEQYEQEFECSFEAAILGAYYGREIAQAEAEGRITSVAVDAEAPVHTAWDLGIGDSTAVWFFQVAGQEVRVVDHYENSCQPLSHYVSVINSKSYKRGTDWLPHDARIRSLTDGRTRVETLVDLGRSPRIVPDHKLMDGINAARLTIPRCWFDAKRCRDGIEALRQYRAEYDEKTKTYKDYPRHDWASHTADAFRYLSVAWRELAAPPPPKRRPNGLTPDDLLAATQRREWA